MKFLKIASVTFVLGFVLLMIVGKCGIDRAVEEQAAEDAALEKALDRLRK